MDEGKLDTRVLLALAACIIVVLALGLSMCGGGADTSSPAASVESYFAAVADDDAEEACSVGTDAFREEAVTSVIGTPSEGQTCEETVANVPDEARELVDEFEYETIDTSKGAAVVEVTFDAEDSPVDTVRFDVVREGDEWHIGGFANVETFP